MPSTNGAAAYAISFTSLAATAPSHDTGCPNTLGDAATGTAHVTIAKKVSTLDPSSGLVEIATATFRQPATDNARLSDTGPYPQPSIDTSRHPAASSTGDETKKGPCDVPPVLTYMQALGSVVCVYECHESGSDTFSRTEHTGVLADAMHTVTGAYRPFELTSAQLTTVLKLWINADFYSSGCLLNTVDM